MVSSWKSLIILLSGAVLLHCGMGEPSADLRGLGQMGDPLVIGVSWPFSAKNDLFREGIDLAVKDLNEAGGVLGRPFEVVFADDGGNAGMGKSVAQGFAGHPGMVAILGHYDSFIAESASLTYEYNGLLMITPGATNPKLTEQGFKRVFRMIPNDRMMGGQLAEIAARKGYRRLVIVHEQSDYGRQLSNAIEFRCEEMDLTIVDRQSYDSGIHDYRLLFNRLDLLEFDAIFIAGIGMDAAHMIDEARNRGFNQPFLGANGLDTPDLFRVNQGAVEGTLVLSVFDSENPNPYVQHFNRHFAAAYDQLPDAWAAQAYDSVHLLAHGIRSAQNVEPSNIAAALHGIQGWYGVTGAHYFDEKGEIQEKPMVMKVVKNGRFDYFSF